MEELGDRANDVLRSHHSTLTKLIVSAGLRDISDECESKGLISPSLKEKVVSNSIGKTESDRASILMDEVRRSLGFEPHETMDDFLCILFKTGDRYGQSMAKQLAKEYGFPLTNLNKAIESHRKAMSTPRGSVGVASKSPVPTVRELAIGLKSLVKWEDFAQHLPHIGQSDIMRVKIENSHDIEGQKRALFDKWLRIDTDASWEVVVEKLDLIGEGNLSKDIRTKYNLPEGGEKGGGNKSVIVESISSGGATALSTDDNSTGEDQTDGGTAVPLEIPDRNLDPKKLYQKIPTLQDILTIVPPECLNAKFEAELNLESTKNLEEAVNTWINEETCDVTWLNLIQAIKKSGNVQCAKFIAGTFLRRPSVYERYISTSDYESFDDLGI